MNLQIFETLYAQAGSPKAPSMFESMFLPMAMIFVLMYFFMIRPQAKKQKEHEQLVSNLKSGDEVITTGGIIGRIKSVSDGFVSIETGPNTTIKILKAHILAKPATKTDIKPVAKK